MASDDPSSFSFIVRLVHLLMYTLVELSFGITQLLRTSAAIDTMLVPEVASRLRDDPLTQSLVHQVGVFHVFVGLIAYMLRDEILDQRASARPFYMGMVCLQFALLRVTWQAEQAGLMNEHGTTTATCIAAIFGGGAAVALWTAPSVKDAKTTTSRSTGTACSQLRLCRARGLSTNSEWWFPFGWCCRNFDSIAHCPAVLSLSLPPPRAGLPGGEQADAASRGPGQQSPFRLEPTVTDHPEDENTHTHTYPMQKNMQKIREDANKHTT